MVGIHFRNNTPMTTLTKVIILGGTASKKPESINLFIVGQALRGILMKGKGGKNVGHEPDRKIASKLGHL